VTALESGFIAAIFHEARTFTHWQLRPVPEAMVEAAFALARLGPTSGNCQPLRLVLVRSPGNRQLP
jgi:3-hydroxypropanoate dehydrogenase